MKDIKECLVCGYKGLRVFVDLGIQPLANNLKSIPKDEDIKFPLRNLKT